MQSFCSKLIFSFNKLSYHLSPTQPSQYNKIHFSYHDKLQQLQSVMQYMHSNDALQGVYTTSSTFLIDMYSTQGTDRSSLSMIVPFLYIYVPNFHTFNTRQGPQHCLIWPRNTAQHLICCMQINNNSECFNVCV